MLALTLTGCSSFLLISFPTNRGGCKLLMNTIKHCHAWIFFQPMEVPHLRDQNGRRRCYVLSKSVARFVSLILYFLPLLKVCCQTSLLALAPACIVTGLHHVVMERRDHDGSGGNILLTGCNRTSGQVVVVVVFYHIYWQCSLSAWKSVVAQEKISPSFQ